MEKVLVTGGAGFIGTNLVLELLKKYEVRILDLFPERNEEFFKEKGVEIFKGDIRDFKVVSEAVKGSDTVVHLAAHTDVVLSTKEPRVNFEINVIGTLNLLEASVKSEVDRFIFASSSAALGEQEPPINEKCIPKPISPYGASKLAGEAYCNAFYSYGLKTSILRFANVYGPYSSNKDSVIAKFMRDLLEEKPLVVYGDGKQTRDFVHVEDICRAIELCFEKNVAGEAFQIGSGEETSILDLINELERITENKAEVNFKPARSGEILRNFSDISKAKELLGFQPKFSLGEGLKSTYDWFKK